MALAFKGKLDKFLLVVLLLVHVNLLLIQHHQQNSTKNKWSKNTSFQPEHNCISLTGRSKL